MSYNLMIKENEKTTNHEGAGAFLMSAEMELYTTVCCMALQPKFYETPQEQVDRVAALVRKVAPEYVAKLAVYARREMHLRSVPLLLIVELAKVHSGDNLVSRTIEQTILRADEIMELLMCYQWRNPKAGVKKLGKLSHQVQCGLQMAFNKFDEYQFAKYDRDNLTVKLRDALFIVHPKAKDDAQQCLFDKIAEGTLQTPYTWETELSALGQQTFESDGYRRKAFAEKWTELIGSGQLGYMALLRNLRNMLATDVDDGTMQRVADRISNEHEIGKARQLPFRYLSAYKELKDVGSANTSLLLSALERAALISASAIRGFSDKCNVMIACDMSGSMQHPLSGNGKVQFFEVGNLLAMMRQNRCRKVVTGIFGDVWKTVAWPHTSLLENTCSLNRLIGEVGYGTNGNKPLEWLIQKKMVVDKVVYFTDCQFWNSNFYSDRTFAKVWDEYKEMAPHAHLYLFDLAGYGQAPVRMQRKDVTLISGWSERIFDMLDAMEHGADILEEIKKIEF